MKYEYRKGSNIWVEARIPFEYGRCGDGIVVYKGALPGSGIAPEQWNGISIPEEIDGIPVTELRATYQYGEIDYIEASCLKRIYLRIVENRFFRYEDVYCHIPVLGGGCQDTVEVMELEFCGEKMHLCKPGNYGNSVTKIVFTGRICEECCWDDCYYERGIFQGLNSLKRIVGTIAGRSLGGETFDGCKSLVSPPDIRVKYLSDHEFRNCDSLQSIHLHNGLERMGYEVFSGCISLRDFYVPDTVTHFGKGIFQGCINLETVHLPEHISEITERMFSGCERLRKVFLGNEIKTIAASAFEGCRSLQNPWIPEQLKTIGERAFFGCTAISKVVIPSSVTAIGEDAFGGISGLIIMGDIDTVAESYARKNKIAFITR